MESAAMITLDAAIIAGSGGVALATKVHWARRIWAMAEVAGAIGNITINTSIMDPNSDLGKAVDAYNLAMGIIGVKNLGKGILNFAKELPEQTTRLLKENKGLRDLLTDYKIVFKSRVSHSKAYGEFDDLDDISRQKINEQEKVFDDLLRETNATPVHFSQQQIDDYVRNATKNADKDKVMLGKYDKINKDASYNEIAKSKRYTYFDLEDEWGNMSKIVNNDLDEMWRINEKFIQNQFNVNKSFYFSHNPNDINIVKIGSFYEQEVKLLKQLVQQRYNKVAKFNKVNNYWKLEW
jgi:hypothetical protein